MTIGQNKVVSWTVNNAPRLISISIQEPLHRLAPAGHCNLKLLAGRCLQCESIHSEVSLDCPALVADIETADGTEAVSDRVSVFVVRVVYATEVQHQPATIGGGHPTRITRRIARISWREGSVVIDVPFSWVLHGYLRQLLCCPPVFWQIVSQHFWTLAAIRNYAVVQNDHRPILLTTGPSWSYHDASMIHAVGHLTKREPESFPQAVVTRSIWLENA